MASAHQRSSTTWKRLPDLPGRRLESGLPRAGVGIAAAIACLVGCSRPSGSHNESPAATGSVIMIGATLAACQDVAVCERECDAGSADRCRRLAVSFAFGQGVHEDETRAAALYQRACAMDDAPSCVFAGQSSEFARGVPQDYPRASRLYGRACDLHWAAGCYNLAVLYERGTGVARDRDKAAALYDIACSAGAKSACGKAQQMRLPAESASSDGGSSE